MKEDTKAALGFFACLLGVMMTVVGIGLAIGAATNEDSWDQTEDPACYLHTVNVNRLFGTDTVTRTRYCEVPS